MDTARRASVLGCSQAPGLRKLTPKMLGTIEVAETHKFTSEMHPGKVLAAFKAAAPYLGLRPNVVHAIDWLFRFTVPLDWQPSSRPIVWPSAAMQQQELGLGPSQVKNLNRHLVELGLVVMRDSSNGKRYGRRDPQGRIVEAYGFDLSPLASRCAEFRAQAEAGREERARAQAVRRRATIARNGIRQLLETADEQRIAGDDWDACRNAATTASRGIAGRKGSTEMEIAVGTLERLQREMRLHLKNALASQANSQSAPDALPVDINPKEPKNWPHITTTNHLLNRKDTVIASEGGAIATLTNRSSAHPLGADAARAADRDGENFKRATPHTRTDFGFLLKISPAELTRLAPRLKSYLRNTSPRWPEIVEAADWLRDELGISKSSWGEACLTLGREQAAIAVAVVSAKPREHFRGSPGAYFHGMLSKAKAGELHLARTIWRMRASGERPTS